MIRISIIGSGFVGEQVGRGFINLGHEVTFCDFIDKNLPNFTKDIKCAIENSEVSFICVPTPIVGGIIDLRYTEEATKNVGVALALQQNYHVVVIKSTVVPTTTENIVIPLLEEYSGKKAGTFGVCMSPEFLTQVETSWTRDKEYKREFLTQDHIVIGEYDKKSGDLLEEVYKPLNRPISRTDLKTAEMVKYASNCMLATKISYWNEIFLICQKWGIDSQRIAAIVGIDSRIGKYGTVHGKAFGGNCLPKDVKAFISFVDNYHMTKLLKAVDDINEEMKEKYGARE